MLIFLAQFSCAEKSEDGHTNTPSPAAPPERMVIHEVFSGSNCGPCAPAAENIAAALADKAGEYVLLKYQIGSDPYITSEAVSRRMMYLPDAETYSIPWVVADGLHEFHPNEMSHGGAYTAEDFDELAAFSTELSIDVSATVTDQTIAIDVELLPSADIAGEDLRLMVAIKEKTTVNNVGSNGQTEFHDVFKKFVPDGGGTPLEALTAGERSVHSLEYTFEGEYDSETSVSSPVNHNSAHTVEDFDDLAVVAWVQDMSSWEVFNAGVSGSH